jgi:hypothetical protein
MRFQVGFGELVEFRIDLACAREGKRHPIPTLRRGPSAGLKFVDDNPLQLNALNAIVL